MKPNHTILSRAGALIFAVLALAWCHPASALTLYRDNFESYLVQNPAPNPLTNGPAGGQWFFVDPDGTTTTNEHRIWDSTTVGSGFNSRVWASLTNYARLTNAISLSKLPAGGPYTVRLSFAVAADTSAAGRTVTFGYNFYATGGTLTFVSGTNADASQVLTGPSGTGIATSENKGKSPDRRFQLVFQASGFSGSDKFVFDITRITNNAGGGVTMFLDDVELMMDETTNAPALVRVSPVASLQHVRVQFSEPLDPASATNTASYSIPGLTVLNAWMLDSRQVELQTSDQTPGASYTLQATTNIVGLNTVPLPDSSRTFTAIPLVISPVRYDAGTPVSNPSGPPDPTSAEGKNWTVNVNNNVGMTKGPVIDDQGYHAWRVTDSNSVSTGGSLLYTTAIDPLSDTFARTNAWRITTRCRHVTNYASTAVDQLVMYGDSALGQRFGIFLGINSTNCLFVQLIGGGAASLGNTYVLTDPTGATNYHTHVLAYDPSRPAVSYYFDGRLIVANFTAQTVSTDGLNFGSGASTAKGEMNYNLVQLDVAGAASPTVSVPPRSSTNGVGQKVTFTSAFSPWVNSYQWLLNDVPIVGATSTNYTTDFITLTNDGQLYKLRAYCALGDVDSAAARLTVTTDTNPPTVVAILASPMLDRVRITFSEPVIESYATDIANYTWITAGVTNVSVVVIDPLTIELRTTGLAPGAVFNMRINNVRDTSNLVIATNTPASFYTPRLSTLARYYAGTPADAPAGPPDPTSTEGGSWTHFLSPDPALVTNAIANDNGWNAWEVTDNVTTDNRQFNYYYLPMSAAAQENANRFGWVLSVRAKLMSGPTTGTSAIFAQYEDYNWFRNILNFALDPNYDLRVGLGITNSWDNYVVTTGGMGAADYHLHQIAYDPGTRTASYYCDGLLVKSAWSPVYIGTNSTPTVLWGAVASIPTGSAYFNLFEFAAVEGPLVSAAPNGANIDVSYRGILEQATGISAPVWTPVATNATGGTYSVPASNVPALFFRARGL